MIAIIETRGLKKIVECDEIAERIVPTLFAPVKILEFSRNGKEFKSLQYSSGKKWFVRIIDKNNTISVFTNVG